LTHISFGKLPVSNQFQDSSGKINENYDLTIVQDNSIGLVHIKQPIDYDIFIPKYSWLTETEPSEHFDNVSNWIAQYSIDKNKSILGLSYRDQPLINYLKRVNYKNSELVDYSPIQEIIYPGVSQQAKILSSNNHFSKLFSNKKYSILLSSRIIHHVANLREYFENIKELLYDDGIVIFEVPDCERGFRNLDYNIVFEEHINYFTEHSFISTIKHYGFDIVYYKKYSFEIEDALVAVAMKSKIKKSQIKTNIQSFKREKQTFKYFVDSFNDVKKNINDYIDKLFYNGKIVIFGAGHHGCMFVNIMQLENKIDSFIDDNLNKHKYFSPGSGLPIRDSNYLKNKNISFCLVSVSQINEEFIIQKINKINDNIIIYSIFPTSNNTLPIYNK